LFPPKVLADLVPGCEIQNLKFGSVPIAYPAYSTKAFCEVRNDAIEMKYCELIRHDW